MRKTFSLPVGGGVVKCHRKLSLRCPGCGILGTFESIHPEAVQVQAASGSTILGEGSVSLILDVMNLIKYYKSLLIKQ